MPEITRRVRIGKILTFFFDERLQPTNYRDYKLFLTNLTTYWWHSARTSSRLVQSQVKNSDWWTSLIIIIFFKLTGDEWWPFSLLLAAVVVFLCVLALLHLSWTNWVPLVIFIGQASIKYFHLSALVLLTDSTWQSIVHTAFQDFSISNVLE